MTTSTDGPFPHFSSTRILRGLRMGASQGEWSFRVDPPEAYRDSGFFTECKCPCECGAYQSIRAERDERDGRRNSNRKCTCPCDCGWGMYGFPAVSMLLGGDGFSMARFASVSEDGKWEASANVRLIVAAVNSILPLCDEVELLREEVASLKTSKRRLRDALNRLHDGAADEVEAT